MLVRLNIHQYAQSWEVCKDINAVLERAVQTTWEHTSEGEGRNSSYSFEAGFVLADNDYIQSLNKTYRHQDKPTNVLSFPNEDSKIISELISQGSFELGDVIFAFETIMVEAKGAKISLEDHFTHMVIHGFLHLLGYDHIEDSDAEKMEKQEAMILNKLGIANPYAIV